METEDKELASTHHKQNAVINKETRQASLVPLDVLPFFGENIATRSIQHKAIMFSFKGHKKESCDRFADGQVQLAAILTPVCGPE